VQSSRSVLRATLYTLGLAARSLKDNWSLATLSLVLAVMLWVFVTDVQNPTRTDVFPAAIPIETVNVAQDLAVASLSESAVSVRISAPEDMWKDLTRDDFRASVDLSGVSQKQAEVTVRVDVTEAGSVEIVGVSPSRVTVSLETVTSKSVPVRVKLVGAPPLGFDPSPATASPEQVTVSGPESLVNLVQEAVADVNLTGVRVSLRQVFTVTARDSHGGDIDGVNLEPSTVQVDLPIVQQEFSSVYVVNPSFRGVPAEGFSVTDVKVNPSFVTVTAPIEVLQSISTLTTEAVDIDGATSEVIRIVGLQLPAGASVGGQESVTVQVKVSPVTSTRGEVTFSLTPQVDGLAPELSASLSPKVVQLTVAASLPILDALSSGSLRVTLDVSGLEAGVHDVEVKAEVPPGVDVVTLDPPTVEVTLS
jgi:YbbR domain-containing protein